MFEYLLSIITSTGAIGVGIVMFIENIFPPIPSELVMPLAGFLAAQGDLSLVWVMVLGTAGAVLGACLWYWVGACLGMDRLLRFVDRYGRWLTISRRDVQMAMDWFDRHQGAVIFWGRMIPGVRTLISVPAGIAGMAWGRFLLLTTAGATIWNAGLVTTGYILRANYDAVAVWLDPITTLILLGIAGVYVMRLVRQA